MFTLWRARERTAAAASRPHVNERFLASCAYTSLASLRMRRGPIMDSPNRAAAGSSLQQGHLVHAPARGQHAPQRQAHSTSLPTQAHSFPTAFNQPRYDNSQQIVSIVFEHNSPSQMRTTNRAASGPLQPIIPPQLGAISVSNMTLSYECLPYRVGIPCPRLILDFSSLPTQVAPHSHSILYLISILQTTSVAHTRQTIS